MQTNIDYAETQYHANIGFIRYTSNEIKVLVKNWYDIAAIYNDSLNCRKIGFKLDILATKCQYCTNFGFLLEILVIKWRISLFNNDIKVWREKKNCDNILG